jgi:dTDP-4-dehydrorhamnose 3,5-epimerase
MDNTDAFSIRLEKHPTKDIIDQHVNGELTVIWRDWDDFMPNSPKMIYVTSVNPKEIKGPHLHLRRNSYFTCIHGKVVFVIRNKNGNYEEFLSSSDEPNMICVPKNIPSAHLNLSNETSQILSIADISWKPNDDEMKNITFDDYDWTKWQK